MFELPSYFFKSQCVPIKYRWRPVFCSKTDARFHHYNQYAPEGDAGFEAKLRHLSTILTAFEILHLSCEKHVAAQTAEIERRSVARSRPDIFDQWKSGVAEIRQDVLKKQGLIREMLRGYPISFISDEDLFFIASSVAWTDYLHDSGIKDLTAFLLESANYPEALEMDPAEDREAVPEQGYSDSVLMAAWRSDVKGLPVEDEALFAELPPCVVTAYEGEDAGADETEAAVLAFFSRLYPDGGGVDFTVPPIPRGELGTSSGEAVQGKSPARGGAARELKADGEECDVGSGGSGVRAPPPAGPVRKTGKVQLPFSGAHFNGIGAPVATGAASVALGAVPVATGAALVGKPKEPEKRTECVIS